MTAVAAAAHKRTPVIHHFRDTETGDLVTYLALLTADEASFVRGEVT